MSEIQVVWFKRDLRVRDHRPLYEAAQRGPVLPLYIVEPSVIHAPDYSRRHWLFTRQCLMDLRDSLQMLGAPLVVRQGETLDVLSELHQTHLIAAVWAHEETGNDITYQRDRAVHGWTSENGVTFHEIPNNGVIRRLKNRDERLKIWNERMRQPIMPIPQQLSPVAGTDLGDIPQADELELTDEGIQKIQPGGEQAAQDMLHTFLYERGPSYHSEMSSPVTAEASGSRLSTHLAYGTLSVRQVYVALRQRQSELKALPPADYAQLPGSWKKALRAFESRLAWHDHFIQKLEDDPRIEYESFVPQYDTLRDNPDENPEAAIRWQAYTNGCTGYPMVDASIRYLRATGWINFRMRAMLVSFASYNLWIKWQWTDKFLARLFTDYEPGIHFSQTQMQSGTTGINTLRIYNPIKQGYDHDPEGVFIRKWVPELAELPLAHLHEPWTIPPMTALETGFEIGRDYPPPIVEHKSAVKRARGAVMELRRQPEVKATAEKVVQKHGSRKKRSR